MKQIIQKHKTVIAAAAACLVIAMVTMSFQNESFGVLQKFETLAGSQDTFPAKGENNTMTRQQFDAMTQQLDINMANMTDELKKIDWPAISKQIDASIAQIDFKEIETNVARAMKQIDFDKLNLEVNTAMKNIDWTKLNADVAVSLKQANEKIKKIDMTNIKLQMEQAKLELRKSKELMTTIDIDKTVRESMESVSKAKEELSLTSQLFLELEKDHLIDRRQGFTIEYKNKNLFINGQQQSDSVTEKYRPYIKGDHFQISIEKE